MTLESKWVYEPSVEPIGRHKKRPVLFEYAYGKLILCSLNEEYITHMCSMINKKKIGVLIKPRWRKYVKQWTWTPTTTNLKP